MIANYPPALQKPFLQIQRLPLTAWLPWQLDWKIIKGMVKKRSVLNSTTGLTFFMKTSLPVLCVPLIDFITLHKVKCSSCIHSQMAVSLSQLGCLTIQRWAKKGHKFYVQSLTYIEKIQADFLDFHMGPTNLQIKISLGRNKIVFLALVELPLPLYCY